MIAEPRQLQAADRDGREVRRLPGGRLLRQGDAALSSGSDQYDAFMTGAYQTWSYGPAGWIVDLNEYITDPAKTNPNYNWDDVLPNLRASTAWSGVPVAALGGDGAKQWAIPWGFELNSIAYNRASSTSSASSRRRTCRSWSSRRKMIKDAGKGVYGVGVRGSAQLGHDPPGLPLGLLQLRRAGLHRRRTASGKAAMNSAGRQGDDRALGQDDPGRRAEELGDLHLVSGRHRSRRRRLGDDLRRRHPGLLHERRRQQGGGQHRLRRLHPQPGRHGTDAQRLDLVAGDGNAFGKQKDAAWTFMQWASGTEHGLFGARKMDFVNPVRAVGLEGRGVPRADRQVLPGLSRAVRGLGRRARRSTSRRSRCS